MDIIAQITSEFHLQAWQVENVVKLIDEGNTIPFIARYRKEAHGTLDDQVLREISERLEYLRNLDKRREEVRASIEGQEKLTEEIAAALSKAVTLAEIEDIYRPFKPKRRTRASIAREKGLEPLAQVLYEQRPDSGEPLALALAFLDPEKGVETAEAVSYTHLRAHETRHDLVCRLLLEKKKERQKSTSKTSAHL